MIVEDTKLFKESSVNVNKPYPCDGTNPRSVQLFEVPSVVVGVTGESSLPCTVSVAEPGLNGAWYTSTRTWFFLVLGYDCSIYDVRSGAFIEVIGASLECISKTASHIFPHISLKRKG